MILHYWHTAAVGRCLSKSCSGVNNDRMPCSSHQCMPNCAPCEGKYPSGGWVDYFEDSWKAHLAGELKGGEQHVEAGHQVQSPHMAAPGRLRLRRRLRIRRISNLCSTRVGSTLFRHMCLS